MVGFYGVNDDTFPPRGSYPRVRSDVFCTRAGEQEGGDDCPLYTDTQYYC